MLYICCFLKEPKHGENFYFDVSKIFTCCNASVVFLYSYPFLKPHKRIRVSKIVCVLHAPQVIFRRQLRRGSSVPSMKKPAKNTKQNAPIVRKPLSFAAEHI